jgi:hypothetical protein
MSRYRARGRRKKPFYCLILRLTLSDLEALSIRKLFAVLGAVCLDPLPRTLNSIGSSSCKRIMQSEHELSASPPEKRREEKRREEKRREEGRAIERKSERGREEERGGGGRGREGEGGGRDRESICMWRGRPQSAESFLGF